mmetsp:Transcript_28355/g.86712  ORF Transcript_28355/g.86712 Transcript_28355/m.86712 type:complete len:213 (-) Transcript_28355:844-1482(-)
MRRGRPRRSCGRCKRPLRARWLCCGQPYETRSSSRRRCAAHWRCRPSNCKCASGHRYNKLRLLQMAPCCRRRHPFVPLHRPRGCTIPGHRRTRHWKAHRHLLYLAGLERACSVSLTRPRRPQRSNHPNLRLQLPLRRLVLSLTATPASRAVHSRQWSLGASSKNATAEYGVHSWRHLEQKKRSLNARKDYFVPPQPGRIACSTELTSVGVVR